MVINRSALPSSRKVRVIASESKVSFGFNELKREARKAEKRPIKNPSKNFVGKVRTMSIIPGIISRESMISMTFIFLFCTKGSRKAVNKGVAARAKTPTDALDALMDP